MKLDDMSALAREDLSHIPRGPHGSIQNEFRAFYHEQRLHGLSKGETRLETFLRCLRYWRELEGPEPSVEGDYFLTED